MFFLFIFNHINNVFARIYIEQYVDLNDNFDMLDNRLIIHMMVLLIVDHYHGQSLNMVSILVVPIDLVDWGDVHMYNRKQKKGEKKPSRRNMKPNDKYTVNEM